jgi:hypothetical protein
MANALRQNQVGRLTLLDFSFNHSVIIPTDTDHTQSLFESNPCSRSRTYGQSSTTKSGTTAHTTLFLIQPFIHYLPQTLKTLYLSYNGIGGDVQQRINKILKVNRNLN